MFWQPTPKQTPTQSTNLHNYVAAMCSDDKLTGYAGKHDLAIQKISWEDTGRNKGSCWGPNISDMTLYAYKSDSDGEAMPVIRRPNFADKTCDRKASDFKLAVEGARVTLQEYLTNLGKYVGNDEQKSLYRERDSQILTSVQYCVLPLNNGAVEFAVQLFNYQSEKDNPAVLVIVVSQEGTSAQVITEPHQKLYLNAKGRAHSFSAKRLTDDRKEKGKAVEGKMDQDEQERNALFVFQVPLKYKERPRRYYNECAMTLSACDYEGQGGVLKCAMPAGAMMSLGGPMRKRGMEHAVLQKGKDRGTFVSTKDSNGKFINLERDDRFPIRCTIQKYQVTDDINIGEEVFKTFSEDIDRIYKTGEAFGSLVTDPRSDRKTEPMDLDSDSAKAATQKGMQKGQEVYNDKQTLNKAGLAQPPLFNML